LDLREMLISVDREEISRGFGESPEYGEISGSRRGS